MTENPALDDPPGEPASPPGTRPASPAAVLVAWGGAVLFVVSLAYFLYSFLARFDRPVVPGPAGPPTLLNLALFTGFAAHHSAFARPALKRAITRLAGGLERSMYTWVSSALFLFVCWAWQPVPGELYRLDGTLRGIALAVQAAGIVLTALGSRALNVFDLAGVRQIEGAANTPDSSGVVLVTSGAFRLVRHPLYLGWALFVFGTPHMTATRAVFAAVSTLYLAIAIPWEERGLAARFGRDYEDYCTRVRWRMIPGIY